MKLIDNAKQIWHHWSTQALTALTGLGGVWAGLPEDIKNGLPAWASQAVCWTIFGVAVIGLGSKFVDQPKLSAPTQPEESAK